MFYFLQILKIELYLICKFILVSAKLGKPSSYQVIDDVVNIYINKMQINLHIFVFISQEDVALWVHISHNSTLHTVRIRYNDLHPPSYTRLK